MYCTIDDILKLIDEETVIQLCDDEGDTPEITSDVITARINSAIENAAADINIYLEGRYVVPLSTVPASIARLCAQLSIYNLYARRDYNEPPKVWEDSKKNAIKLLERISEGKLEISANKPVVNTTNADSGTNDFTQTFSKDSLKGF